MPKLDNENDTVTVTDNAGPVDARSAQESPLIEETLIEEVSIDGMCGVY